LVEHADYAAAFARLVRAETGEAPILCPVNEISFVAWSGGSLGHMNPFALDRGNELKRQVVRAALAGTRAAPAAAPSTLVLAVEPRIHIVLGRGRGRDDTAKVECLNAGQWQGSGGGLRLESVGFAAPPAAGAMTAVRPGLPTGG
jgi:hypothetical protein